MISESSNNKRIAKNTIYLYGRMLFLMVVGLFASRVILRSLGVEDFGIYNIVGGVIIIFSFLSSSLSSAISRFMTYDLGKGDVEQLKKTFTSSVIIQILFALVVILLAETIGLWFLNEKLVIPADRVVAANWAYQFTIVSLAVNLISIPYNASIISHEKMDAFAYVSVIEAIGKLAIAYGTFYALCDKLIFYSAAMLALSMMLRLIYGWYCKRNFAECKLYLSFDKQLVLKIFELAGWNSIGVFSSVVRDQGGNILINLFFGPTVNAARSIAMQVNTVLYGFVSNFMTALNPQITKNYANGNNDYMMKLIFQGSRYSFYIMLYISLPVIINAHYILSLWLGIVPAHSAAFVQLSLLFTMNELLAGPLYTAMLAAGNTRNYQIAVGGCQLLNLPIGYLALKLGAPAEAVFIVAIFVGVCCEMTRIYMLRKMINLPARLFLKKVYLNVWSVAFCASILPVLVGTWVNENFSGFLMQLLTSLVCISFSVYWIGLRSDEKTWVRAKFSNSISIIRDKL